MNISIWEIEVEKCHILDVEIHLLEYTKNMSNPVQEATHDQDQDNLQSQETAKKEQNKKEIGEAIERFHDFLTRAGLQRKEYQTEGIKFCLSKEIGPTSAAALSLPTDIQIRGGIVADEMGLGKTIMMIGLIVANFQKRTLIVLPVALVKQWEQQILKNTGHHALVYYGAEKKRITQQMLEDAPVVITTYGHMIRRSFVATDAPISHKDVSKSIHTYTESLARRNRNPLYKLKWGRVIFDEAHHLKGRKTQIFKSVSSLRAEIRWFVTGTPIQNSIHDLYSLCVLLGVPAAYYTNKENIRTIVKALVLKRTKQSVGLSLPPLTTKNIVVPWANPAEMMLSHNLHSGIGCLNIPGGPVADAALPESQDMSWFPEPSPVKIGRMIQAKQSCIYPRLACRKSVPQMPDCEDDNYSSKIKCVVRTILSRKDNGKRKIVFCHFRGEIDYIQARLTTAFPSLVVRYLDGRTKENERREILAPNANVDVLILQIQTCCEGLNLQQFSEVYFVSPDWNPSIEDQAIARCHRFGQTEPVVVFRFVMAPFKIHATPETQHLLDAQREREQQQAQQAQQTQQTQQAQEDEASQASTADADLCNDDENNASDASDASDTDNECIAIDTIEAYTANVQNKKRVFADEILRV